MKEKILLVDDDLELYDLLKYQVKAKGFEIHHALFWRDAIRLAYKHHPDIVILDITLPEMDGFEICRRLREMSDIPIIMLTARASQEDLVTGFQAGADDYLTKPFHFDELEVRMRALLNRAKKRDADWLDVFSDGTLQINLKENTIFKHGELVLLTPTEYHLLEALVRNRGTVLSHRELVKRVWGTGYLQADGSSGKTSLQLYIGYLRNKLEEDPTNPKYIQTKWGVGYWFVTEPYLESDVLNHSRR